jgi:DNA adenine methylase
MTELEEEISNTSPLRYPGGKTRACKKLDEILNENFNIKSFHTIVSPFFGGGSFEFYMQNKYNINIICNDKFKPLYNLWNICKNNNKKEKLCELLFEINETDDGITKEKFIQYRNDIMKETDEIKQAFYYFIINRCSFSGATLSGGFSLESSKKRFTKSSINRVKSLDLSKMQIHNKDFKDFITDEINLSSLTKSLLFLDPPYYLEKGSKLYGKSGDMHEDFEHINLYNILSNESNKNMKWLMTYNNCDYIKNLYKNYTIIDVDWSYGMNKTKKSSEIVIINK